MTAFESAREVEFLSWQRMKPFINEITEGRFVLVNKGAHARKLQEELGDILANLRPSQNSNANPFSPEGNFIAIEVKSECKDSPNLFLETWSNRNLKDAQSHAERGCNPGWLFKLRSDLLFYYFLESDKLCIANILALKRWAFRPAGDNHPWPLLLYPEREQRKRAQLNDTWGVCVPISDLQRALGPRSFKVTTARQLAMFDAWEGAQ